jgi:nanoRNase/pAp phosphatase (c-di-AMP/oligoRNAs hydrolase)
VSEEERLGPDKPPFEGASYRAPSAAQVVWDYYEGDRTFNQRLLPLLQAVNKSDSGKFTREDILYPKEWVMVSFLMDPRTGLGRFKDYRISNYHLMEDMIRYCRTMTAEEILEIPDVQERTQRYFEQQTSFKDMIERCCRTEDNVIVTNLLEEEIIYTGNRFLVYALYPDQNIEVRVMWGREKQNVVITAGHSILNRTCQTNLGRLLLRYGGGGHERVATCQVPTRYWKNALSEILMALH